MLRKLGNEELISVGKLGLAYNHLKSMPQKSLCDEMVHAWLRRDDNVVQTPSWENLAIALEATGFKGIAADIRKVSAL